LRGQQSALRWNWSGAASELAADRLGRLGDRTRGIGTRAGTVQDATQSAGDALVLARNTMPPPPGDPTGLAVAGTLGGAGVGAVIGGVLGAGAGGVGAVPGAAMGAVVGAVVGGGASLFLADVAAAEQKAQAVHVMERYEASLRASSRAITPTPAGATQAGMYGVDETATTTAAAAIGGGGGSTTGGVPWAGLTGAQPVNHGLPVGLRPGDGALLAEKAAMSRLAAARAGGAGGMGPGSGARSRGAEGDEDKEHRNRMPLADHGLFDVDERAVSPVIGT
jgi:hypothetical protein